MGTPCTIKFYEKNSKKPFVNIIHQCDGYIKGVGYELAKWLKTKTVVHGYGLNETMEMGFANGMSCLAAQYIAENKKQIGNLYISDISDTCDFNYTVKLIDDEFIIEVSDFKGTPDELIKFVKK